MRVVQAVFGVFHHFELARELERRGHLARIFSTFPWQRVKREGIDHSKVGTFPWLQTTEILLGRYGVHNKWLRDQLGYANALAFDEWTLRNIPACDAFVAISGAGLKTGAKVQREGGVFICDRGSTHIRHRAELVHAEHMRWNVPENADDDPRDLRREEAIYETADAITVPSTHSRRTYIERGIPAEKIHMIPYGVLLERFQKVADPPTDSFEALYVGRVNLPKGFPYLLEAWAKVKAPNKRLTIIGGIQPEMPEVLKRLPTDSVRFLGTMPQTELKEHMSRSHCLVMPSLDEGMALVQGQAMACGCPVVATTASGSEDLVTEGRNGFVVPVRDPDALAEKIQMLADDRELQRRMSEAAIDAVKNLGGWKTYGDRWEALLYRLTGKAQAKGTLVDSRAAQS